MKRSMLASAALSAFVLVLLVPFHSARADVTVSGGVSVSAGVVVAPAPPPTVVVVAKPVPKPPPKVVIKTQPMLPPFEKQIGFGFRIDGAIHGHEDLYDQGMGGAGLLLRMRLLPHFATEIAVDAYGGKGYDGVKRVEIPFSLGLMWMPMYYLTRVQFYTIGGIGGASAFVGEDPYVDKPFYLGGFMGLGIEVKLGARRRLALFTDLRGFIRKRLNDRPEDPFIPDGGSCRGSGATMECTDWEGGVVFAFGLVAYF